jgi:hypothetical protein
MYFNAQKIVADNEEKISILSVLVLMWKSVKEFFTTVKFGNFPMCYFLKKEQALPPYKNVSLINMGLALTEEGLLDFQGIQLCENQYTFQFSWYMDPRSSRIIRLGALKKILIYRPINFFFISLCN